MFSRGLVLLLGIFACLAEVSFCENSNEEIWNKIVISNITVGSDLLEGIRNWRVHNKKSLITTRLFNSPLPGGDILVGWTDSNSVGHVSYMKRNGNKGYTLKKTVDINNKHVRGIAALDDTSFGVLAWVDSNTMEETHMYVQKWSAVNASGNPTMVFQTEITNLDKGDDLDNYPYRFDIGDSRMEYSPSDNSFYIYYHVHCKSGHEGDTYYKVNAATGVASRKWRWGCSHSMSNLLSFHPVHNETLSVCVTDCYPGTSGDFETESIGGLYTENKNLLQVMGGGCNGCVGGEVGMIAPVYNGKWVMIFNSHRNNVGKGQAACVSDYHQDIGLVFVGSDKKLSGSVKWLTNSNEDKVDPGLARYGNFSSEQVFLVGWKTSTKRFLGLMDATGKITNGPKDVSTMIIDNVNSTISWGARDDTWRTLDDGSVVWLEAPTSPKNMIRVYLIQYGDFPPKPEPDSSSSSAANHSSTADPSSGADASLSVGSTLNPYSALLLAVLMGIALYLF